MKIIKYPVRFVVYSLVTPFVLIAFFLVVIAFFATCFEWAMTDNKSFAQLWKENTAIFRD